MTVTHVITIESHPTDPNVVSVVAGPDAADVMGRFEPARFDARRRSYLLHVGNFDAFQRFAKLNRLYLVDERDRETPHPPPVGGASRPLRKCGSCGYTQAGCDEVCGHCTRCHGCSRQALNDHEITDDEQDAIHARWQPVRDEIRDLIRKPRVPE